MMAGHSLAVYADVDAELAKAQESLTSGDYAEAYDQYLHIAEHDDHALAKFSIALFHENGWGRAANHTLACEWYAEAAAGHIPAAQHFHAECLKEGTNAPADPGKAAHWYAEAANNGHVISWCSIAELLVSGLAEGKEYEDGLVRCSQVAEQGLGTAMVQMGRFHLEGGGELRDYQKAHDWFDMAIRTGRPDAQYYLGMMYRDGLGRDADLGTARYWFEASAASIFVPAYFPTGQLYFESPRDPVANKLHPDHLAKAYMWLSAAVERSNDEAEVRQARMMLDGIKTEMPPTWLPSLDEKLAEFLSQNDPVQ